MLFWGFNLLFRLKINIYGHGRFANCLWRLHNSINDNIYVRREIIACIGISIGFSLLNYYLNVFTKFLVINGNTRTTVIDYMNIHRIYSIILFYVLQETTVETDILVKLINNPSPIFFREILFHPTICVRIMLKNTIKSTFDECPRKLLLRIQRTMTSCVLKCNSILLFDNNNFSYIFSSNFRCISSWKKMGPII